VGQATAVTTGLGSGSEQELADALIMGEEGIYGFLITEADGTVVASHNSTLPFQSASLYKLVLMADILNRIEMGMLSLDDELVLSWDVFDEDGDMYFGYQDVGYSFTIDEYLLATGAYSSNVGARTLLALVDTNSLQAIASSVGMTQTAFFVYPSEGYDWDAVTDTDVDPHDLAETESYLTWEEQSGSLILTTAADMVAYLRALNDSTLVSEWVSEQIWTILSQQAVVDRIPYLLPDGVTSINKTGNFDDVVNDVGIIYLQMGVRIVALLSQEVPDSDRATQILQRLALIATGETQIPPLMEYGW